MITKTPIYENTFTIYYLSCIYTLHILIIFMFKKLIFWGLKPSKYVDFHFTYSIFFKKIE